jgi:hypothetical protein
MEVFDALSCHGVARVIALHDAVHVLAEMTFRTPSARVSIAANARAALDLVSATGSAA